MDIYTDGSCSPNPGKGAWAFVSLDKNNELLHYSTGFCAETTNNIMELTAILEAIRYCCSFKDFNNITIYSDSEYAIKCVLGVYKKLTKNIEFIKKIQSELYLATSSGYEIDFEWVRGHNGNVGNEMADYYANMALNQGSRS